MERNTGIYSAPRRCAAARLLAGALALLLVASCSSAPPPSPPQGRPEPEEPTRSDVVELALTYMGTPYRYGGKSRKGLDCSGFVYTVFRNFDVNLPRTVRDQVKVGEPVRRADLVEGDLVFFKTSGRWPVGHVGIYLGDGKFIHASTTARRVRVDALSEYYFHWRFVGGRRVMD